MTPHELLARDGHLRPAAESPEGATQLLADYARVLLVPVPRASAEELRQAWSRSQEWMAEVLEREARAGRPVDGYLLLELPEPGDAQLRRVAQEIELDPSICRKQVLRPSAAGWGPALARVMVHSLPPAPEPVPYPRPDSLPPEARQAEAWLEGRGVRAAAELARAHVEDDDAHV